MTFDIDDKVFNGNQFYEGGETYQLRLDELNSLRDRLYKGENVFVGDTSARDVVDWLLKRAGVLGHRLFSKLEEPFAEALLKEVGDNPLAWVNPQWDHAARTRHPLMANVDGPQVPARTDFGEDNGSLYKDGYQKPTAEQAEATKAEQQRVWEDEQQKAADAAEKPAHPTPAESPYTKDEELDDLLSKDMRAQDEETRKLLGE